MVTTASQPCDPVNSLDVQHRQKTQRMPSLFGNAPDGKLYGNNVGAIVRRQRALAAPIDRRFTAVQRRRILVGASPGADVSGSARALPGQHEEHRLFFDFSTLGRLVSKPAVYTHVRDSHLSKPTTKDISCNR